MNPVGDTFQQETKYDRNKMSGKHLDFTSRPKPYKDYLDCQSIDLPEPSRLSDISLYETLKNRRSVRLYPNKTVTKEILGYLLWASTGISYEQGGYAFRTAPSAGALYPIETYLVVNYVKELDPGVYHYNIKKHNLELLKEGEFDKKIAESALGQQMCMSAPVVFIWSAIFERMKWKYDQRAYRYVYLDAGHIAENLALAATSLKLGTCQIGALFDDDINQIIEVDGKEESVIYMSVVG